MTGIYSMCEYRKNRRSVLIASMLINSENYERTKLTGTLLFIELLRCLGVSMQITASKPSCDLLSQHTTSEMAKRRET